jgi:DNA repair protein RadA/Sms
VGEIGLGGELRRVSRIDVRRAEAARLGFRRLLVPAVCLRELGRRSDPAAVRAGACELVPLEAVADAVDWLSAHAAAASRELR